MARVNVGVDPKLLSDQHLVAESVEITMITGDLRSNNYLVKSEIPQNFVIGKGHMNFFKNKLVYLKRRLDAVNDEMLRRGFRPGTKIDLDEFPVKYHNDWTPTMDDSITLRERIADRLITRANGKPASRLHRYGRRHIGWYNKCLGNKIINSELFYV